MSPTRQVTAIDVHAAGEAGRVLIDAHWQVRGADMSSRLQYCREHLTGLRHLLLREPRGYPGLLGVMVLPAVHPDSDFGIIVLEQGDFAAMSGANLICAVTALLETGTVAATEPQTRLRVDTAAGTVGVTAEVRDGQVVQVTLDNVPAFALHLDRPLEVPEYGRVPVDIAFGGQFYVQASAESLGLTLEPDHAPEIIRAACALLAAARREISVAHPLHRGLDRISLPMIHAPSAVPGVDGRNTVVMPHGEPDPEDPLTWRGGTLDRSPGGTGTCARMAALFARGQLGLGRAFVHESILGTTFTGQLHEVLDLDGQPAVRPTLSGRGWITGYHRFVVRADDPFPEGYTLGDLWGPAGAG